MTEWPRLRLGELVSITKGRQVPVESFPRPGSYRYLGAGELEGAGSERYTNSSAALICDENDVLMLWDGERSGLVGTGLEGAVGSTVARLRPGASCDGRFLFHALRHEYQAIRSQRTGTGIPHVPKDLGEVLRVALPPLPSEQRRIAEVLDTIDEAIELTERLTLKLTKTLQAIILHQIPRPRLVEAADAETLPPGWTFRGIESLAINHDGRRIPVKSAVRQQMRGIYPYYGASGVIDMVDDYLFDGDYVLLGEDGENVLSRKLPLAFEAHGRFWVNNHAHIFEPLGGVDRAFLVEVLEAADYAPIVSGSAQPKITQTGLRELRFPCPDLATQETVAREIRAVRERIHHERAYANKLRLVRIGLAADVLSGRVHTVAP